MQASLSSFPLGRLSVCVLLVLCGCSLPKHRAPVEDRPVVAAKPGAVPAPSTPAAADATPLPAGSENAGKPGYYTVKPGDTLIRVALEHGQNWRELVRWNSLDNPNLIEVGQVLRVLPPGVDAAGVTTKPIAAAKLESKPLDGKAADGKATDAKPGATAQQPGSAASASVAASSPASAPAAARNDDDGISWGWPAAGNVISAFDEQRNKGISFTGKAGDPVLAAADGRVMYVGSGLRGYGNTVIIKHGSNYLTAYAHNQTLLVKEDQVVRKGQKIAEMGSSDADQVKLHFELRKQGKPVDPAKLLPAR
ncbi:peptidoglycan DD-metalloendopeptidase family protein [Paucibacter sp. APW11]|uniref:Peptidoglycan DD-metalloendopeptidase family protein n=1 Tax=Roseateles aquae TaxID=3077235 RepID=A0ABU3P8D8_9BURK|nr:peptidoglycan DD-metalloendopeptidase family protein [Paucibacter sp. APW11]MDT8998006.1 peptidoglycan DD-metalloendopeptidase family protein [Paucibacter sp. APW11]